MLKGRRIYGSYKHSSHGPQNICIFVCCGLTLIGSSAPHSCSLTPPQWDGEKNCKGKSKKISELKKRQLNR